MLPRVGWEGFGKVQNGSEECGGLMVPKSGVGRMETSAVGDSAGRRKRSLRHLTRPLSMKHEKGGGCFSWFPRMGWEGLGNAKMKHEKGFGCFMAPKSGVGRVSECKK